MRSQISGRVAHPTRVGATRAPVLGRADIGAIENPEVERQGQTAGAGRHRRRKRSGRSRAMSFDS